MMGGGEDDEGGGSVGGVKDLGEEVGGEGVLVVVILDGGVDGIVDL